MPYTGRPSPQPSKTIHLTSLPTPDQYSSIDPDMQDNMMLAPMATHYVPTLPPSNPAPIDLHLDADMDNNNTTDTTQVSPIDMTSKTTISPGPKSAESTSVKMQMDTQTVESATETSNQRHVPVSRPAEVQSAASVEVKMHDDSEKSATKAKDDSQIVEEIGSVSPVPPEDLPDSHTTSMITQHPISGAITEKKIDVATIAPPSTEMSTEPDLDEAKPEMVEEEAAEATKAESNTEVTAASEPEVSNIEAHEPMDLDVLDNSDGKSKNTSLEDHDPNTPAAGATPVQSGSDQKQVESKDINLVDVSSSDPDSNTETSQSDDTTKQVSRLHAAYDSSGESRVSGREEEQKTEGDSVQSAQAEDTSSYKVRVPPRPEPIVEEALEVTALPAKPQSSLFGGPAGKQLTPIQEATQTSKVDSVTNTETPGGFKELFEDQMTDVSTEMNSRLQDSAAWHMEFDFGASHAGEDAEPDLEQNVEPEAVTGAEREALSLPPSSDHDAKPDMSFLTGPTSPAYSHTTSNHSLESQKTSASHALELNDWINSGDSLYPQDTYSETPEELSTRGNALSGTDPNVVESVEELQPCNCEPKHPCQSCVHRAFTLRPRPNCMYFVNVPDNDTSGDFTGDTRYFPSSREVAWEDRDEDEVTIDDGEEDHVMSGGLPSNTDPMSTIPFNKTDSLIRDKNPFEEESSSEDEAASKKSRKRKKKANSSKEVARKYKRPRITAMSDESDVPPPYPLSRASKAIKKTASKVTENSDESDTQPPQSSSQTSQPSKPTKKTTSRKKKTTTNPAQTQSTPTIIEIVQRIAKPISTKLSYPIHFNCKSHCSICTCPSYAIIGTGSFRHIKIYDFGHGNREMPDANQAGKSSAMQPRPQETSLCMVCTTKYMRVLMCKTHDVVPLDVFSPFDAATAFTKAVNKQCTKDELAGWCCLCPAAASYHCDKNCGAKFCDTCANKVHGEHDESLSVMLEHTEDKITKEYKHGLRADADLLRKGGELQKFLVRMAGAGKSRAG